MRRLGLARAGDPESEDAVSTRLLASAADGPRLRADMARDGRAFPAFGPAPVQFVDVFPRTPDRKIHLVPEALDREAPAGLYGYPARPGDGRGARSR